MDTVKVNNRLFEKYISAEEIDDIVKSMAMEIANEMGEDEVPVFVGVMNGAFMFAADFIRHYPYPCEISFVKMSSYDGAESIGKVQELIGLSDDLKDRTVVILEDIIDTGNTLQKIYDIFESKNNKELRIATLLFKIDVYTKELPIDYIGKVIEDKFVLGYGLDYDELGRNYPNIYQLKGKIMNNIVLFGPPGAGKGTQADVIKEKYGLVHISTGDVFRYNIKNETELGILAKSYMDDGNLVPDDVTISMLKKEVEKNSDANGFIFDGFPRTTSQAEALDIFLSEKGQSINAMVSLEVAEDILEKRLLERGAVSGRADDQDVEKIRNRFNEYNTKTSILKEYYQGKDKYYGIDGVGTINDISGKIIDVIDKL
ncbi:MAG: adenylate kinase [Flavobacteriaceae bacterium]|nr:adenylate kinase [Flavobacteriaceae bacterium]